MLRLLEDPQGNNKEIQGKQQRDPNFGQCVKKQNQTLHPGCTSFLSSMVAAQPSSLGLSVPRVALETSQKDPALPSCTLQGK